jgi:hypothetical protein
MCRAGTLAVADGTHSVSILLLGNYTLASFNLGAQSGGGSGTVVTDPPLTTDSGQFTRRRRVSS